MEETMQDASSGFSFNWLAGLLGLILGIIGVLIAWLIWGKNGLLSSLIGAAIWLIVFVIILA